MNKFISFEGIDCSGKSTQIELLKEKLIKRKQKVYIARDPGGTQVSEAIRNIILNPENAINERTEMLLFLAARSQLVKNIILPKLENNYFVICDRFIDSTVAYQGYGRKISINLIKSLNKLISFELVPSITFLLDIDIKILQERKRARKKDRMELLSLDFFSRVRNGYLDLVKKNPDRIVLINGEKTTEEINKHIWDKLKYLRKK